MAEVSPQLRWTFLYASVNLTTCKYCLHEWNVLQAIYNSIATEAVCAILVSIYRPLK